MSFGRLMDLISHHTGGEYTAARRGATQMGTDADAKLHGMSLREDVWKAQNDGHSLQKYNVLGRGAAWRGARRGGETTRYEHNMHP